MLGSVQGKELKKYALLFSDTVVNHCGILEQQLVVVIVRIPFSVVVRSIHNYSQLGPY